MTHPSGDPVVAADAASLLAVLSETARLVGYEAVLEAAVDRFGARTASACVSTTRSVGERSVPSVILVFDEEIAECWLTGNTVWSATTTRPTPDP